MEGRVISVLVYASFKKKMFFFTCGEESPESTIIFETKYETKFFWTQRKNRERV